MNSRLFPRLALVLSFAGIFVSGVLAIAHVIGKEVPCGMSGGCHTVAEHWSSKMVMGIDNAYLGLAAYVLVAILAALRLFAPTVGGGKVLLLAYIVTLVGTIFSGYLTYLEAFVINAYCMWCLASAAIITLLMFVHAAEFQRKATNEPDTTPAGRFDFILMVSCVLLSVLVTGGTASILGAPMQPTIAPISKEKYDQFPLVPPGTNVFGKVDAPITIVEFADLQCPMCRAEFPKVKDLVSRSNGKMRLIFRHFPLEGQEHNMAYPAAGLAEFAGTKGRFYEFIEAFYSADPESLHTPDGILKVAKDVGLDLDEAKKAILDEKSKAFQRVSQDVQAAAAYGLKYTPTFFIYTKENEAKPDVAMAKDLEEYLGTGRYKKVLGNDAP